jgi:hypothetical protein
LVNDSCFYQENNYEGISNDILRKCISIAECEIFLAGYFQNQEAVMKFSKDADRLLLTLCYPFETKARRYWSFWNRSGEKAVKHQYHKI